MRYEKFCNDFRFLCCHQQIEVVHDLFSPPITPGNLDLQSFFVRRQIRAQRFRLSCDLSELK